MKRAVIVNRVSTGEQVKGTSLDTQLERGRRKAESLGAVVYAEYEDAGVSGALLDSREGMMAAIADIKAGRADILICDSLSRFSRDEEHQQRIKREIKKAGGTIAFCDMEVDIETPEGEFMFAIHGGAAAWERRKTRTLTMRGRKNRALNGLQPSRGRSPYGYVVVNTPLVIKGDYPGSMLGQYVQVETQAAVVRRIFEMYVTHNKSMNEICRIFNAEQIPPPGSGPHWRVTSIISVISHPVHKGAPAFGRTRCVTDEARLSMMSVHGHNYKSIRSQTKTPESEWIHLSAPPIVSVELWDAANNKRKSRKTTPGGRPDGVRLLSGLLSCPMCGSKMTYEGRRNAYRCIRETLDRFVTGAPSHGCRSFPADVVEQSVERALVALADSSQMVWAEIEALNARSAGPTTSLAALEAKLLAAKDDEAKVVRLQVDGVLAGADPAIYASIIAEKAAARKAIEAKIGRTGSLTFLAGESKLSAGEVQRRQASNVAEVLSSAEVTGYEKRNALALILEKAVPRVEKDGVEITLKGDVQVEYALSTF